VGNCSILGEKEIIERGRGWDIENLKMIEKERERKVRGWAQKIEMEE